MVEERVQNAVTQLWTDESRFRTCLPRRGNFKCAMEAPIQLRVQAVSGTMDAGGEASHEQDVPDEPS